MRNFEAKTAQAFGNVITIKNSTTSTMLNFLSLDSQIKNALVIRFTDFSTGYIDAYELNTYLNEYRIDPKDWEMALLDLKNSETGEMTLLTKVKIVFDAQNEYLGFQLPEFNFPKKKITESAVDWSLVKHYKSYLMAAEPVWGEIKLSYNCGVVQLVDFVPINSYTKDTKYYKEARNKFTTEEWIDMLLAGLNFNPDSFESIEKKIYLLQRFMPLVEKRMNMIELTKKGNSKSFSYSMSSRQKLVTSSITRANAFYNNVTKTQGFFLTNDAVAFDEVQSIRFGNDDLFSLMKTYLENGQVNVGSFSAIGEAGLVLVGNAKEGARSLFADLDKKMQESAFIDRFACLIQGSQIDRMTEERKFEGIAITTDYLMTMFHEFREDFYYRAIVDELLITKGKNDIRNLEAVKKSCCAMMKLIFPNVKSVGDVNKEEFKQYCLKPAIEGRERILVELRKIDSQYDKVKMPDISIKE